MAQHRQGERALMAWRDRPIVGRPPWRWFDELLDFGDGRQMIEVEEFTEGDKLVVRAEIPGVDPEKDVQVTVSDHTLRIAAERSETKEEEGRHFHRRELRTGSFVRTIPLPEGVDDEQISASYSDGILEVRAPIATASETEPARRVPVTRS